MPSHTPTPEFVTVPEPPAPRASLRRRIAVFLRDAVVGGLFAGTAISALAATVPVHLDGVNREPCFPTPLSADDLRRERAAAAAALATIGRHNLRVIGSIAAALMEEAEVRARVREIDALRQTEAALRATLPRSRPGLIVPNNQEEYR